MATDGKSFDQWIDQAKIPPRLRSPKHLAVLQAAFAFLQHTGNDYASKRRPQMKGNTLGHKLAYAAQVHSAATQAAYSVLNGSTVAPSKETTIVVESIVGSSSDDAAVAAEILWKLMSKCDRNYGIKSGMSAAEREKRSGLSEFMGASGLMRGRLYASSNAIMVDSATQQLRSKR